MNQGGLALRANSYNYDLFCWDMFDVLDRYQLLNVTIAEIFKATMAYDRGSDQLKMLTIYEQAFVTSNRHHKFGKK